MGCGRVEAVLLVVAVVVAVVAVTSVEGWGEPWSVDTGRRISPSARYHCCCPSCPGRSGLRGCFPCRNQQYYCNCEQCSCFPEKKPVDSTSFLQMLLRGGFSSSRFRRGADQEEK